MDRSVVERAQRGDRDAFAGLVHAVGDRLYALAYRILRDQYLAEDALQQALLSAWTALQRGDEVRECLVQADHSGSHDR